MSTPADESESMRRNHRKQLVSSTIFNRTVVGAAAAAGVPPARFLERAGVDLVLLSDPEAWLPASLVEDFLQLLGQELGHPAPGIWVGEHVSPEAADVLGYAMRTARTLGDAYRTAARYYGLVGTGVEVYFEVEDGAGRFIHAVVPELANERRHRDEMILCSLLTLGRTITGSAWTPNHVLFQHREPEDTSHHRRVFGSPVSFDEPACQLAVEEGDLLRPSSAADHVLHEILERLARLSVSFDPDQQPLVQRLRQTILHALPAGDLSLDSAARSLGMGERTLQRRLAGLGTSHKELVRQTRYYLAEQYLRGTDVSIDEIAFLLGYSNTPSFTRAFRSWSGMPPSEYRARENGAAG